MIVQCQTCSRSFDDEFRSTICPHDTFLANDGQNNFAHYPDSYITNCPLVTGLRPCECDLPRCPVCNYTKHDAQFEMDHNLCYGRIPGEDE